MLQAFLEQAEVQIEPFVHRLRLEQIEIEPNLDAVAGNLEGEVVLRQNGIGGALAQLQAFKTVEVTCIAFVQELHLEHRRKGRVSFDTQVVNDLVERHRLVIERLDDAFMHAVQICLHALARNHLATQYQLVDEEARRFLRACVVAAEDVGSDYQVLLAGEAVEQ